MYIHVNGGTDPTEFNERDSAHRIGERIRIIRNEKGLTQAELGSMVGLSGDRIQKYENGARKPKTDMIIKIANALGVSSSALADPVSRNQIGAMFAMFELERCFNMKIEPTSPDKAPGMCLSVSFKDSMYRDMKAWYEKYSETQEKLEKATTQEEKDIILKDYHMWEWSFPEALTFYGKEQKKQMLMSKIEELQKEVDKLEEDGE